jgi:DNA polymerase IV
VSTLCRDCGTLETAARQTGRCAACGSPRLVCHAELGSPAVAHVDCDAFYAAVEKRDRPELADQSSRLKAASDQAAPPIPAVIAS